MKISYFNYLYDLYGVSIGSTIKALELYGALERFGFDVRFHWRKEAECDSTQGIQKYRMLLKQRLDRYLHAPNQFLKGLNYLREEISILHKDKPDLLIARLETNIFSPPIVSKVFDLPYIAEVDSPVMYEIRHFNKNYYLPYRLLDRMEKDFILKADRAFCVSNQLKQYFVKRGIPSHQLEVIPNGADITRFHPDKVNDEFRRKHHMDSKIIVGFVGSFHYWHGVEKLMGLIEAVLTNYKNAGFILVGKGGPMHQQLQSHIQSKGYTNRVLMTDYIPHDQIPDIIHAMDIVLAPYPDLPFFYYSPVKVYEYMACGKPVVTSEIGQISEIIQDHQNGMLCKPGCIDSFSAAIGELIRSPDLRQRIGETAFLTIRNKHTWKHRAEQLCDLVHDVIDK